MFGLEAHHKNFDYRIEIGAWPQKVQIVFSLQKNKADYIPPKLFLWLTAKKSFCFVSFYVLFFPVLFLMLFDNFMCQDQFNEWRIIADSIGPGHAQIICICKIYSYKNNT